MYFSREDILKIQQALQQLGIKDSEFPEAYTPISGNDTISIVQDGYNKKINVQDFISQLGFLHNEDLLNITDRYDESYITLSEAIKLIPDRKRKEGLIISFLDINGDWRIYLFRGNITLFNNESLWKDLYDFTEYIVNSILPDEEDITKIAADTKGNYITKLKDREYNPENFSGMATKILRKNIVEIYSQELGKIKKNILYQDDFNVKNCVYEIRYDFDLNNTTISIPDNCVLKFEGGSLNNGILNIKQDTKFRNTKLNNIKFTTNDNYLNYEHFDNYITGLQNKQIYTEKSRSFIINVANFGIFGDGATDWSDKLVNLFNLFGSVNKRIFYFPSGIYTFKKSIDIPRYRSFIIGDGMDNTILLFDTKEENVTAFKNPKGERYCSFKNLTIANGTWNGATNYNTNYVIDILKDVPETGIISYHQDSYSVNNVNGVELYGDFDNVKVSGFSGVGVLSVGGNNRISNSYIIKNKISISTLNNVKGYTSDLRILGCYISGCRIAILSKNWNLIYSSFIDEIKEYAISNIVPDYYNIPYNNKSSTLNVNIQASHFNHIDKSLIKADLLENSLINCVVNRATCNYSGLKKEDINENHLPDACIFQAETIRNCKIDIISSGALLQDSITVNRPTGNGLLYNDTIIESSIIWRCYNDNIFLGINNSIDDNSTVLFTGNGISNKYSIYNNDKLNSVINNIGTYGSNDLEKIKSTNTDINIIEKFDLFLGKYSLTRNVYPEIPTNQYTLIQYTNNVFNRVCFQIDGIKDNGNYIKILILKKQNDVLIICNDKDSDVVTIYSNNNSTLNFIFKSNYPIVRISFIGNKGICSYKISNITEELKNDYEESNVITTTVLYLKGLTSDRPSNPLIGFKYYDTDIKLEIIWNGTNWTNALGNNPDILTKGTTGQRPTLEASDEGFLYYDTTLHEPIWWNGTLWIDGTNTPM